jgi:hypothetical protein
MSPDGTQRAAIASDFNRITRGGVESVAGGTERRAPPILIQALGPAAGSYRQIFLNGSGDIAVYRTVLVILAWPRKCWSRRVSMPFAARV